MTSKLRILCLHGYTQNAIMYAKKTAAARKGLEDIAEFIYVTAPHHIIPPTYGYDERASVEKEEVSEEHKPFGWWFAPKYKPTQDGYFVGFKETMGYMNTVLKEQGPFDGILGFSQGASYTALLTEMLESPDRYPEFKLDHSPLKFAVIIAGFKPTLQEATNFMLVKEHPVKTPTLHYIGDLDTLVLPERMIELTTVFEKPVIFRHTGGHFLPTNAASHRALDKFIRPFAKD